MASVPPAPGAAPEVDWHGRVWRIAWPTILSNLTQPVVGAVDTGVAGHLPGPEYLGGVGVAALIFGFVFWAFGFLRLSTTGYIAQALGRGDAEGLKAVLLRALVLAGIIALFLLVLQGLIAWGSLLLIQASPEVSQQARLYFDIRIWAAPAVMGNYIVLGALIGLQRAGWALVTQAVIAGANVVLDLLFVVGFGWQVEGLAAATVIAEVLGLMVGIVVLLRVLPGDNRLWPWAAARLSAAYRPLLALNRDLFIRTVCLNLAFALFVALSARISDVVLAANEVLMMFLTIASCGLDGFANACEAIVGEATGRRRREDLKRAVFAATLWAGLVAALAALAFALLGPLMVAAMTDLPEVRAVASDYLPWVVLLPLVAVWSFLLDGVFIGATRGRDMRNAMLAMLVVYVPVALVLWQVMGNHGLWLAIYVMMALRALTLLARWPALMRDSGP